MQPAAGSKWKLALAVVAAVMVLVVIFQNTQAVETRFLFLTVTMPRALLLFLATGVGFVLGLLVAGRLMNKPPRP